MRSAFAFILVAASVSHVPENDRYLYLTLKEVNECKYIDGQIRDSVHSSPDPRVRISFRVKTATHTYKQIFFNSRLLKTFLKEANTVMVQEILTCEWYAGKITGIIRLGFRNPPPENKQLSVCNKAQALLQSLLIPSVRRTYNSVEPLRNQGELGKSVCG